MHKIAGRITNKVIPIALFLFTVIACAKPTYVSTLYPQKDGKDEGVEVTCDARFQKSGNCISLSWQTPPSDNAVCSFLFKIYRPNEADDSPLPVDMSGSMNVRLLMPSMGHGSSPITVTQLDTGTFRADSVFFSMHGGWQIIFETKQNGTVIDKAVLPFNY